jgi:hypothetical protein
MRYLDEKTVDGDVGPLLQPLAVVVREAVTTYSHAQYSTLLCNKFVLLSKKRVSAG